MTVGSGRLVGSPVIDPKDADLMRSLAATQSLFGDQAGALRFLTLADWIAPDDPRTTTLRAVVEMRRGHIELACDAIARLRESSGEVPEALRNIERRRDRLRRLNDRTGSDPAFG